MIFDRPTSSELIKAVMDFLDTKIKDELPPHLAFKLRITNNVLGMVQREIDQGETLQQEVYDAMQSLMHSDELTTKKLSELIKDGKIDLKDEDLKDLLAILFLDKITNKSLRSSSFKSIFPSLINSENFLVVSTSECIRFCIAS